MNIKQTFQAKMKRTLVSHGVFGVSSFEVSDKLVASVLLLFVSDVILVARVKN